MLLSIQTHANKMKKYLNKNNIITILMMLLIISMFVFPEVKANMIQGLMKFGIFQPTISSNPEANIVSNSNNGIKFRNQKGEIVSLSSLKGKVIFINFWATWCPPCIAEMPSINQLQEKYRGNSKMVILMVDVDSKPEKSTKFMQRKNFNLEVYTPASAIPNSFLESNIPTTVILNKNGEIVFKHEGGADYTNSEFINFVDKLLK